MNLCRSLLLSLLAVVPARALAQDAARPADLQAFYDRVRPALVAVKYQWDSELGRQEVIGSGIVVSDDGLVMIPMYVVFTVIPDKQMKDFKIILPSDSGDETEIDADFVGRDERCDVAYVKARASDRKWTSLHFQDHPVEVGQPLYGVGLLPKSAGYKAYLTEAKVSATLRGEVPEVLVSGGLAAVGSPVFDADFNAIGVVWPQEGQDVLLNSRSELNSVVAPPHFFVAARFFLQSLADPPTAEKPIMVPWMGVTGVSGVNEQIAKFLDLKNVPAVQIGDVVPGAPAALAGLEPGNIVIKMNGQPLERGDLPEELPMIFSRHLVRMKVGDKVTLTVLPYKGAPTRQITVTLAPRPRQANEAERYFAQDLGFVAREAVFADAYENKMKPDATGVVVDLVRRDGAAAQVKLTMGDWIMQLNNQTVSDLTEFRRDYETFRKQHPRDPVVLVVHRHGGEEETLNIEPPQTDALPGGDQP